MNETQKHAMMAIERRNNIVMIVVAFMIGAAVAYLYVVTAYFPAWYTSEHFGFKLFLTCPSWILMILAFWAVESEIKFYTGD